MYQLLYRLLKQLKQRYTGLIFELILFNGVIMTKFRQKILIFLTRIDEYRTAYYQY